MPDYFLQLSLSQYIVYSSCIICNIKLGRWRNYVKCFIFGFDDNMQIRFLLGKCGLCGRSILECARDRFYSIVFTRSSQGSDGRAVRTGGSSSCSLHASSTAMSSNLVLPSESRSRSSVREEKGNSRGWRGPHRVGVEEACGLRLQLWPQLWLRPAGSHRFT